MAVEIKKIYEKSHKIYGASKIHQILLKKGVNVGLKLVQKLRNEHGLKSIVNKKFKPAKNSFDKTSREYSITTELISQTLEKAI